MNFSPGWNISLGTKYEISREESRENQAAILFPAFQPGLKFLFDYMRFFQPGLKKSPCNRQFDFKRILFQKPGWNFSPGWNSPCNPALISSKKISCFCHVQNPLVDKRGNDCPQCVIVSSVHSVHNFPASSPVYNSLAARALNAIFQFSSSREIKWRTKACILHSLLLFVVERSKVAD